MPISRALVCLAPPRVEWYTKGMTSHRDCTHPKTKAARARCRKGKAEVAEILRQAEIEDKVYHDTYIRPFEEQETARKNWEAEQEKFCQAHINSAEQNADDTAHEEGFEPYSKRWCDTAISTLYHARDNADKVIDFRDPEKGQYLEFSGIYFWVDNLKYREGWVSKLRLIDREGRYSWVTVEDLENNRGPVPEGRSREQHEAYGRYISEGIGDTDGHYAPIDFQSWLSLFGKDLDSANTGW